MNLNKKCINGILVDGERCICPLPEQYLKNNICTCSSGCFYNNQCVNTGIGDQYNKCKINNEENILIDNYCDKSHEYNNNIVNNNCKKRSKCCEQYKNINKS